MGLPGRKHRQLVRGSRIPRLLLLFGWRREMFQNIGLGGAAGAMGAENHLKVGEQARHAGKWLIQPVQQLPVADVVRVCPRPRMPFQVRLDYGKSGYLAWVVPTHPKVTGIEARDPSLQLVR